MNESKTTTTNDNNNNDNKRAFLHIQSNIACNMLRRGTRSQREEKNLVLLLSTKTIISINFFQKKKIQRSSRCDAMRWNAIQCNAIQSNTMQRSSWYPTFSVSVRFRDQSGVPFFALRSVPVRFCLARPTRGDLSNKRTKEPTSHLCVCVLCLRNINGGCRAERCDRNAPL